MKKIVICVMILLVFLFNTNSVQADIETGLIAHFPFESSLQDYSGSDLQGIPYGNIEYVPGIVGEYALNFDGSTFIAFSRDYLLPLCEGTISVFVKVNSQDSGFHAETISSKTNYRTPLVVDTESEIPSAGYPPADISYDNWHLVTIVYEGGCSPSGIRKTYIDGVLAEQSSGYANNAEIGSWYGENDWYSTIGLAPHSDIDLADKFIGQLDDVRIYDRALSESDIMELFNLKSSTLKVLFQDDFNDNSIDPEKWTISGYNVYERNGYMDLRTDVTDTGGIAASVLIEFDPNELLVFERDTFLHYANNYFIGRFEVYIEGAPEYTFGINYGNMSYSSGIYNAVYGTYLFKNNGSGHSDGDLLAGHSESVPTLWNQWFHEKLVYDAQAGVLKYYVDDQLQISYDIGQIPELSNYRFYIKTHPWGWNTGHYEYMDNFVIYGNESNQLPSLNAIGNKTVFEGELLEFTISAVDPDANDILTFGANNLPNGASFDTSTGIFSWTPTYEQAGNYIDVEFYVMDNSDPPGVDAELITITVGNVNRPPIFNEVEIQDVMENELVEFIVAATDPDGDYVQLSAGTLPLGSDFNASTGLFSWVPDNTQSGNYIITFFAADDGIPEQVSQFDVPITVGDVPTPTEITGTLNDTISEELDLPHNLVNSYFANIQEDKIKSFLEKGKLNPLKNNVCQFIQKVIADINTGTILAGDGQLLIGLANDLLTSLDLECDN